MNQLTIRQALDEWFQPVQGRKVSPKNIKNVWTVFKLYVSPPLGLGTKGPAHKGFGNSLEQTDWQAFMKACQRYYDKYVAFLSTQDSALADQVPCPQENLLAFLRLVFDREFEARVAAGTVSVESKRN